MNTNYIGYIRTYIPVYVGLAITWLAENVGLIIDADTSASLKLGAAGLVVSVYYAVARRLEGRWPWAGRLLGVATQPVYAAKT